MHESQVRLGQKKKSIYTPPCLRMKGAGESRIFSSTYRVQFGGDSAERRSAVDGFVYLSFRFFLSPRRVTVTRSHPVLATGPCWHSFSQRHVTASLHNSEARVLFRVSHWPGPAEARPNPSAPIGCRSINSYCHVLMEESH